MTPKFLVIVACLFFLGCGKENKIPKGIIPPEKMQAVLWDLMRADQFIGGYIVNRDTSVNRTRESLKYYQQIFRIHEITKEGFQKSFAFYRSKPDLFKSLMDSISAPGKAVPTGVMDPVLADPSPDSVRPAPVQPKPDTAAGKKKIRPVSL
jgi:hypothetical protein